MKQALLFALIFPLFINTMEIDKDTMYTIDNDEENDDNRPINTKFKYTPIEVNDDSEPKFRYKKTLTGHTDIVNDICFDSTGSSLISASKDGTVKIWDIKKGSPVLDMKSKKAKTFIRKRRHQFRWKYASIRNG
jgi:WD40 repeat protein